MCVGVRAVGQIARVVWGCATSLACIVNIIPSHGCIPSYGLAAHHCH